MKCLICGAQLTLVENEAERASKPCLLSKRVQEVEAVGPPCHYGLGSTAHAMGVAKEPGAAAMSVSGRPCSDLSCGART